ncbi:hypothetical protein FA13DRAFT_1732552 [Coprinellus micaceus]|uniref:Uncharacterized protein n=1 Tax=Coprinellus micaceus TaxID=71717 RepID=A0A4Y7TBX4_COPMI|nr:hypothetical protein FA13DRAFT_1732552 [Coprinellus micaceus]
MFSQFGVNTTGTTNLKGDMSWSSLMEVFSQSSFFQQDGQVTEVVETFPAHNTQLSRGLGNFWKKRTDILQSHIKKTKETTARQALDWFHQKLVKEPAIRDSVKLDIRHVVKEQASTIIDLIRKKSDAGQRHEILAEGSAGAGLDRQSDEKCEKLFLDIGVLRFPDFQEPYVQVYRIQLTAWTEVNIGDLQVQSGIRGAFNSCQFRPRTSFLQTFAKEALDLAKDRAIKCLFQGEEPTPSPNAEHTFGDAAPE